MGIRTPVNGNWYPGEWELKMRTCDLKKTNGLQNSEISEIWGRQWSSPSTRLANVSEEVKKGERKELLAMREASPSKGHLNDRYETVENNALRLRGGSIIHFTGFAGPYQRFVNEASNNDHSGRIADWRICRLLTTSVHHKWGAFATTIAKHCHRRVNWVLGLLLFVPQFSCCPVLAGQNRSWKLATSDVIREISAGTTGWSIKFIHLKYTKVICCYASHPVQHLLKYAFDSCWLVHCLITNLSVIEVQRFTAGSIISVIKRKERNLKYSDISWKNKYCRKESSDEHCVNVRKWLK